MAKCGVAIEKHHHEVATGGQCELGVKAPIQAADGLMTYKYVIRNAGKKHGKTVTSCPSPYLAIMVLECTSTSLSERWKTLVRAMAMLA